MIKAESGLYSLPKRQPHFSHPIQGNSCNRAANLDLEPEREHTLGILDNLVTSELALSIHSINERNGHLGYGAAHGLGTNHHLHLETITLALGARNDLFKDALLVQTETAGKIADARSQNCIGEQVGSAADKLALEIPSKHTSVASIASSRDNVVVGRLLQRNHLRDELGVVAEVGVHDDDKVSGRELESVDIGCAEA